MRNPFRIAFRPGTRALGRGRRPRPLEEINRITDVLGSVENAGWPCYEGPAPPPSQHAGVDICTNLYAAGPSAVHAPYLLVLALEHGRRRRDLPVRKQLDLGPRLLPGRVVPGRLQQRPVLLRLLAQVHLGDAGGSNGLPNPNDVDLRRAGGRPRPARDRAGRRPVLPDYDGGTIRRIRYFAANQPPIAVAQATPTNRIAPLVVSFDGGGSSDPEGGALTTRGTSTPTACTTTRPSATPSRTYTQDGQSRSASASPTRAEPPTSPRS